MITCRDHKTPSLVDYWSYLGPKRRQMLDHSWAGLFRREILPHLPVQRLAACFDEGQGRPSKELHTSLGVLILQQLFNLSDQETVEQLAFNEMWHYALNVSDEQDRAKYMALRTLWGLRDLAIEQRLDGCLFELITERLRVAFTVDATRQRLDSVHTKSNMRRLGRIGLFVRTIRKFLVNLKRHHQGLFLSLPLELQARYLSRQAESLFSLVKPTETEQTLASLSRDAHELVERFSQQPEVQAMASYGLLKRLRTEQCDVAAEGEVTVARTKPAREVPSGSLQNPSDPEAGYSGHKGQGYATQVMETYSETKDATTLNLISHVEVAPAQVSDAGAVEPALASVMARDLAPAQMLADSLYGSDDNVQRAAAQGVELIAPVLGIEEKQEIKLKDFTYDESGAVTHCPQGQAPLKNGLVSRSGQRTAAFPAEICRDCPRRAKCPVRKGKNRYTLYYKVPAVRVSSRRGREQTEVFRERYRFRSGIEATMSQLDRRTGLKHLRVRGLAAVRYCVKLKAAGLNILRAAAVWAARTLQKALLAGDPQAMMRVVEQLCNLVRRLASVDPGSVGSKALGWKYCR